MKFRDEAGRAGAGGAWSPDEGGGGGACGYCARDLLRRRGLELERMRVMEKVRAYLCGSYSVDY